MNVAFNSPYQNEVWVDVLDFNGVFVSGGPAVVVSSDVGTILLMNSYFTAV
jgi:hypothetical protein